MQLRNLFRGSRRSDVVVDAAAVMAAEREQIRSRRADGPTKIAADAPLVGVALSGGGIRSGTLNLGILQGLAHLGLLPFIDYLSTVSGGGYIGTWLHGVIRRYGNGDPAKIVEYLERPDVRPPNPDSQHDPITFLRKFSSYLAPDMGLFSADFWVILVIWTRNIALNLLILTPFAAVIALTLLEFGYIRQGATCWLKWPVEGVGAICVALVLVVVVILGRGVHHVVGQQDCDAPNPPWRPGADRVMSAVLCTGLMMLTSVLWASASPTLLDTRWALPVMFVGLWFLFLVLQGGGGYLACYRSRNPQGKLGPAFMILFSSVSAAATTGMLYVAMLWIRSWIADPNSLCACVNEKADWQLLAWGPPVMILVFLMGAGLMIGLMGVDFPDFGREWLSRIGAFLVIGAIAWAGLYAVLIFGPYWMAWLALHYGKTATSLAAGWLLTTIAGVLAAKSDKTSATDKSSSGALDWLARIAPPVFVIGFLILVGAGVHAGIGKLAANSCKVCADAVPDGLGRLGSYTANYWCALHAGQFQMSRPFSPNAISLVLLVACAAVMLFMQWRVNINEFSMNHFYKNRLVRCYLGASRGARRRGSRLTGFDPCDDLPITNLLADPQKLDPKFKCTAKAPYYGPYPIVNTTVNLNTGTELAKRERKASSFIFTPLFTGYVPPLSQEEVEFSARESASSNGYRPTCGYSSPSGPAIGTCMAISGAAANPNWGFHTSAPVAFLLTIFDVRLGEWLGNTRFDTPSAKAGPAQALLPLLSELFAQTDARSQFINLSDGGHFENLGLYELIRRRCRFIIAGDGEEDSNYTFESLGGAVRKCRADFGVEIEIDPKRIRPTGDWSATHFVIGRIRYPDAPSGWLLYLKSSMTGDEPEDVMQYKASHPDFPHETTADQFFTESQFESYRKLGRHIVESAFEEVAVAPAPVDPSGLLQQLFDTMASDPDTKTR
jgi:hypothetical protein